MASKLPRILIVDDEPQIQRFLRAGDGFQPESPLAIQPLAEWLAQRPASAGVSGPGLSAFADRLPEGAFLVEEEWWYPRAESLLRLGWGRFVRGERDDFWALEPLYLRPSAAEEKWRGRTP